MSNAPIVLEVALWYHTRSKDHPTLTEMDEPPGAYRDTLKLLERAGLLDYTPALIPRYRATEAMAVYIEALCSLPFPVQKWVMP